MMRQPCKALLFGTLQKAAFRLVKDGKTGRKRASFAM